jgi:hypothetical protein
VAMVAVLFPISGSEPKLEASALEELASLGVTSVALLRDSSIAGLVLEGWAFDARDVERAARAVTGPCDGARMLRPIAQMSVSTAVAHGGRTDAKGDEAKGARDE